jgi:hypothetical protein
MNPARVPSLLLEEAVLHGGGAGNRALLAEARSRSTPLWRRAALHSWHHLALLVVAACCALAYGGHRGQSWHFFVDGSRSLFCSAGAAAASCGLHTYAAHPELQIGPLSLVVARLATFWGADGAELAEVAMTLAGLAALLALEHDTRRSAGAEVRKRLQLRVFLAGLVFVPAWVDLSVRFAHLDDVLALMFTALAVRAVVRGGSVSVGVLLALATLSKPWAVAFVPLALATPRRARALAWAVVPVAATAAVFIVADPATLSAAGFGIANAPSSSLRVLGVAAATTPWWDRPAQFLLGIALGVVAVCRGRWAAAVMVAAAARIALDPGVYSYYTAAVLLGAVVWDVHARKGRDFPIWSWLVFGALFLCRYLPLPAEVLGGLRLGTCVAVVVGALAVSQPLGLSLRRLPARLSPWPHRRQD